MVGRPLETSGKYRKNLEIYAWEAPACSFYAQPNGQFLQACGRLEY